MTLAEVAAPEGALVREPLAATIRRIALPAVMANLFMTAFQMVDAFWIGRQLGATALAAVTTAIFWIWLVISIAEMVSVGLGALAARRHGERRPVEASRIVGDGILFALLLGAVIAMLNPLLLSWLFEIMHTSSDVSMVGRHYLGAYLAGMPLIFGFFAVDAAFRASGDTRTPLLLLAISTLCALVLDPILILGLAGAPALGVRGAAIATLVPRGLACVLGIVILVRRGLIRVTWPRFHVWSEIARIGAPIAATGVAFSAIYVVFTRTTTQFGTPALAALGLGFRVESLVYLMSVGLGAATAAIVGQSLGANLPERARRAGWLGVKIASVPGALMAIALLIMPETFVALFTNDVSVIAEAAHYLRISAGAQLFLGAEIVLEGALGGAGYTFPPMLASTAITALRVPIGAWSASIWGTGGLWWTLALTAAARGIVMALIWRSGRWQRMQV